MNVARMCKAFRCGLPHEYLGFTKNSLEGMLLSIDLATRVMEEELANQEAANSGGSSATSRLMKHTRNK
jgi:hypothetical protein